MPLGRSLRYFGDGFQASKVIAGQRFWRIPVMEGEFLVQESFGVLKDGVGGGNFLILAEDEASALAAAEAAVAAMAEVPGVILPFPGGVVRSGREEALTLTLGELPRERQARANVEEKENQATDVPRLGLSLAPARNGGRWRRRQARRSR